MAGENQPVRGSDDEYCADAVDHEHYYQWTAGGGLLVPLQTCITCHHVNGAELNREIHKRERDLIAKFIELALPRLRDEVLKMLNEIGL